nr:PREDICTED: uncharacterized protein LOC106706835 [Latimeria chalumnae]|eukprot:XP_014353795.1 PREDICTED: uncharacterized protein LOC106706835 [Latimeria chalumnae]
MEPEESLSHRDSGSKTREDKDIVDIAKAGPSCPFWAKELIKETRRIEDYFNMVTALQKSMKKIQSQTKSNTERINAAEQRIPNLEDTNTLKAAQKKKEQTIENITAKLYDLKIRLQCNNLRIVGLPEGG